MPKKPKPTMAELIDLIEKVANDPNYNGQKHQLMEIVYLISNHVKLMGDIKTARAFLAERQNALNRKKTTYPDVTDVMRGVSGP